MFYAPFKTVLFRAIWIVLFFSNLGSWAQTVTASILMTTMTRSSVLIALIQTAATAPVFLFSIPGGVIADCYSRRRVIIAAQIFMAIIAFVMSLMSFAGMMMPALLIGTTFLLNMGLAFNQPAWQAVASTLVPITEVKQAAALNNMSFNLARSLGPAIAGFYYASLGPGWLFLLNGISFLGVIWVFYYKVPESVADESVLMTTGKKLWHGLMETFFFYHQFPQLKFIFLKSFLYFLGSSTIWALLPYLIITHHGMSAADLGLLTAGIGVGAIFNAYSIYYLRQVIQERYLTTFSFLLASLAVFLIDHLTNFSALFAVMFLFGYSSSLSISIFNGTLQSDFPLEVRSRLIGLYYLFFAGSQALGSYLSALLVQDIGLSRALPIIALAIFSIFFIYLLFSFSSLSAHATRTR